MNGNVEMKYLHYKKYKNLIYFYIFFLNNIMVIDFFDDITIRRILNVKKYISVNKNSFPNIKENYVYFYTTDDRNKICIEFLINTIYGDITIPVIGMKDIRIKKNIKYELNKYIYKLEKKRKFTKYLILIKYSNMPNEMIDKILYYY